MIQNLKIHEFYFLCVEHCTCLDCGPEVILGQWNCNVLLSHIHASDTCNSASNVVINEKY